MKIMKKKLAYLLCLTAVIGTVFAPCNKLSVSATPDNSIIEYETTCNRTVGEVIRDVKKSANKTYSDFGWNFGSHWCAAFVTQCMGRNPDEGLNEKKENRNRSVTSITKAHINNGSFHLRYPNYTPWEYNQITTNQLEKCYDSNYTPRIGDLIVYDTNNTCPADLRVYDDDIDGLEHIGIVIEVIHPEKGIDATVVVVEGNSLNTSIAVPFPEYASLETPEAQKDVLKDYIEKLAKHSNGIDYNAAERKVRKKTITPNDAIFVYGYCSPQYASVASNPSTTTGDELFVSGDIDGNGVVTAIDMIFMKGYLLGKISLPERARRNADINSDGRINAVDMVKLQIMLLN